ncbi:MAG: hypothetical protein AAF483_18920 [Planctomycetota bacterium]
MKSNSKYKPEYCELAKEYASAGSTNKMLAAAIGVHEDTITNWKNVHPEFNDALTRAKVSADVEVEKSLYRMAVGYSYDVQEARVVRDADGNERLEAVTLTKFVPPKTAAATFWLRNRQPELWREKQEVEVTPLANLLASIVNTSRGLPKNNPGADKYLSSSS